jgi:cell division protein FtsB
MGRKVVRIVILIILVTMGIGIIRSVYTLSQKKGIIAERQQVLRELSDKNKKLQEDLRQATSPAFIEQAARDKLGLVKEGETVVIMDKSQGAKSTMESPRELPSWKQWWQLFF